MIDYSHYDPEMIVVMPSGNAFIYWCSRKACAMTTHNYGKGNMHWFESLGKQAKVTCKKMYPNASVRDPTDRRIKNFLKEELANLDQLVTVL